METNSIKLRYLDVSDLDLMARMMASNETKDKALSLLGIEREKGQTHLGAWCLAMCGENGLEKKLPAYEIADAIDGDVSKFVWFLA